MKFALAALFSLGTLASATTITGFNTYTISATMDRESNGLHAVADGQFSFVMPQNGNVIGVGDLTDFSLTITDQVGYGWGIDSPIQTVTVGLESIESFSFDVAADSLTMQALILPDNSKYGTFSMEPNIDRVLYGDFPVLAIFADAIGEGDPTAVTASPEPASLGLFGIAGIGLGVLRRKRKF